MSDYEGPMTLEQQIATLQQQVIELSDNKPNLVAIADWCAVTYVTPGESRSETLKRIKEYLKDALVTVASQIGSCAATVQGNLDQQAAELQALDATMRLIENRLASQKEQLGRSAMLTQFMTKLPAPRSELQEAVPEKETPAVFRTKAGTIDFDALDTLGRHPPRPTAPIQGRAPPPPPPPPPGGFTDRPKPPPPPDNTWKPPPPPVPPPAKPKPPPPPPPPAEPEPQGWVGQGSAFSTNRL